MTQYISIGYKLYAIVDDQDYDQLSQHKWSVSNPYSLRPTAVRSGRVNGKKCTIIMHRVITGCPAGMQVDHINDNTLDNRQSNLRICTGSQNCSNSRKFRGKSSYKGVYWATDRDRWRASIFADGRRIYLGCFKCEHEAALAYNKAARYYFKEFARTNDLLGIDRAV